MASRLAADSIPSFIAALPFLFARPQRDDLGWSCRSALASAAAAERADQTPRNTRGRVAYVLCELGYQLARRGLDTCGELPIPRAELARCLAVGLPKVKRVLALFQLSRVVEADGQGLRITDWYRLCGVAGYDPNRLELRPLHEEPLEHAGGEEVGARMTASGEPACFV
jgi:hypothetical protein